MNAFNDFLDTNDLEIKTDFDSDDVKEMQDSEVPGEIEKRLKSSHSLIDQILSKSDYIDLKNDNPDLN